MGRKRLLRRDTVNIALHAWYALGVGILQPGEGLGVEILHPGGAPTDVGDLAAEYGLPGLGPCLDRLQIPQDPAVWVPRQIPGRAGLNQVKPRPGEG